MALQFRGLFEDQLCHIFERPKLDIFAFPAMPLYCSPDMLEGYLFIFHHFFDAHAYYLHLNHFRIFEVYHSKEEYFVTNGSFQT